MFAGVAVPARTASAKKRMDFGEFPAGAGLAGADGWDGTTMDSHELYDNPLVTRYASREMAELWGPQRKISTWRRLWLALAEGEHELGLLADDGVTPRIRSWAGASGARPG